MKIPFQKIEHSRILPKNINFFSFTKKLSWRKINFEIFSIFLNNIKICGKSHKGIRIIPLKQGVYHIVALPFTLKKKIINKAKEEELWKFKYFNMQKI